MNTTPRNVLFLCTGNSCRSIFAEAILNASDQSRLRAYSAGSDPLGSVHPLALQVLEYHGHTVAGLRSKSRDEFAGAQAPAMDLVITVCDEADSIVNPDSSLSNITIRLANDSSTPVSLISEDESFSTSSLVQPGRAREVTMRGVTDTQGIVFRAGTFGEQWIEIAHVTCTYSTTEGFRGIVAYKAPGSMVCENW